MAELKLDEIHLYESSEKDGIAEVKSILQDIYQVWEDFHMSQEQKEHRSKLLWEHILDLLKNLKTEEENSLKEIKERIETSRILVEQLRRTLCVDPPEGVEPISLILKEESLRLELDSLNKVKQNRETNYKELRDVECKLCNFLQMEPLSLSPIAEVPSEDDIRELELHVNLLKDEKDRRYKKFCMLKKELSNILELTELTPESPLEKEILSRSENFPLTKNNFKALEEVLKKAQQKKVEMELKKKKLCTKLLVLWNRLKVGEHQQNLFLKNHEKCNLSNIKLIEEELIRREEEKKENLESFICSLRCELKDLWEKCCLSEEEKEDGLLFDEDNITDSLLDHHEAEVEKWKRYYEDVHPILQKIEQRESLLELMLQLEKKANDPNRFKNRGGNLLQEERQRKKIQHDFVSLEKQILDDIDKYKAETGQTFLFYGEDYKDLIRNQRDERTSQKENEKRQPKNAVQSGITPLKRPLGTTPKSAPIKSTAALSVNTPIAGPSRTTPHTVSKFRKISTPKLTLFQEKK